MVHGKSFQERRRAMLIAANDTASFCGFYEHNAKKTISCFFNAKFQPCNTYALFKQMTLGITKDTYH